MTRVAFLIVIAATFGCSRTPEPTAPPAGFEHAYAAASCAPWDGYAVSLVLRGSPLAPGDSLIEAGDDAQLQLAIYPRESGGSAPSGLKPGTYRWPAEPEVAIGAACDGGQCTTMPRGRITVREARTDGRLLGSVELQLPEGRAIIGTFDAEWRPRQWRCI